MTSDVMGKRIRELRKAHGLNREQFGARIGVGGYSVWRYEVGQHGIKLATLQRIATEFDVSLDWLVWGKDNAAVNLR